MDKSPVITHVMEPLVPGTLTVMTVGALKADTKVFAIALPDSDAGLPSDTPPAIQSKGVEWPIAQRKDECVTVDTAAVPFGVCALDTVSSFRASTAYIANRPRLDWACPSDAVAGSDFRILGRCLVSIDRYPTVDRTKPVSFGGFLKEATRVVAKNRETGQLTDIPVRKSNCYEVHLRVPKGLPAGTYDFYAHNGRGGAWGWSDPLRVNVVKATRWPAKVFRVDAHVQPEDKSASPAIKRAMEAIAKNGGGVLEFAEGTFSITETIVLPPRTVVRGQGPDLTRLVTPGENGPFPPYVLFTGDRDFTISDLRVLTVYTGIIVCAPLFNPAGFTEGINIAFNWSSERARNITVRNCHFTQRIASHTDRTATAGHSEFINKYVVSQGQGHTGFSCVHLKGDDIVVEDNTMLGGGSCVMLAGCSHARISRNTLKCGPAGHSFYAIAKLQWPKDGKGGAKVRGNYCSEIILEENDITSYSERGRDLAYFIYGSEHAHVARNHLHDLEPTFDAEGFGCHLWSARWIEPSIRMTGPTSGEIVDPKGEVTNECLDGAIIDVVGGRGMGQLRRVVRREGNSFEIDKPWRMDPDETSDIVFTAPPPFCQMTYVDNITHSTGINFILWGNSNDVVLDGNESSDGIGISVWSIRLPADQKVWGGAIFTLIINNRLHMNWFEPTEEQIRTGVWAGGGICNPCTKFIDCTSEGYDMLGFVARNNYLCNGSGILFKTTFTQAAGETLKSRPVDTLWTIRNAGVVFENNLIRDSTVGVMIEDGAMAIERSNKCENVRHPVVRFRPAK